jgi:RepB DNA-primase from phage plasmid
MSASTTQSVVRKQLCAMGCKLFEIGVLRMDGRMLLQSGWGSGQIAAALAWLRRENARGAQIFVRPHGTHALSLVDDLNAETILRMTDAGFQPAAVIETSPRNFQAWLNHGRILFDRAFSTHAAKELARRFGGDPSSADWRHFGRLAGFTNQKPKRRLRSGLPPFVRLHQCEGSPYGVAREFLEEVKSLAEKASVERAARTTSQSTAIQDSVRPLTEFQMDPQYDWDLHRADMAWALHAASRGLSEQQIRHEILHARDLSKKGRPERQFNYARRTAVKALSAVQPRR